MFVLRLLIIAVCAIMLLPMDPTADPPGGQRANAQNFCERYPKTCDASGELWAAFKLKLAYGIRLARRELSAQPAFDPRTYDRQKFNGRHNEWRPQQGAPRYSGLPGGTLSQSERLTDWRSEGR